jgi:hypothetical protein
MVLELLEPEDFANHSSVIKGFNMLEQCTIVGGGAGKQG